MRRTGFWRAVFEAARSSIERLLEVEDSHKLSIYAATFESVELADLNYWLQLVFSAGIATLGLVQP